MTADGETPIYPASGPNGHVMTARERTGPLDGLRVIDFSGLVSGWFGTMLLGDLGADVISVEHPEHPDGIREWPQRTEDGVSLA